jgi:hypothetical protein
MNKTFNDYSHYIGIVTKDNRIEYGEIKTKLELREHLDEIDYLKIVDIYLAEYDKWILNKDKLNRPFIAIDNNFGLSMLNFINRKKILKNYLLYNSVGSKNEKFVILLEWNLMILKYNRFTIITEKELNKIILTNLEKITDSCSEKRCDIIYNKLYNLKVELLNNYFINNNFNKEEPKFNEYKEYMEVAIKAADNFKHEIYEYFNKLEDRIKFENHIKNIMNNI